MRMLPRSAALIVVLALSACGTGAESNRAAVDAVTAMYAARTEAASRFTPERSLGDLLTNRWFAVDGKAPAPLTAGIVVGVVKEVRPGKAYVAPGEGATAKEVAFDDSAALWRTATLVLSVSERIGFSDPAPSLDLAVPISGDLPFEDFRAGVVAMGSVVAVLDHREPGATYGIHWDGAYLAPVAEDGSFKFAGLGGEAEALQSGMDTLAELREESAKPPVVIVTDGSGSDRSEPTPAAAE